MTQMPMELQAMLIDRAMADEAFKRELLDNPKAMLVREFRQNWPDDVEIEVLEQTPAKLYLVLPMQVEHKSNPNDELSNVSVITGDATQTQEPMEMDALLIGKAMADEAFKRELLDNPKAAIAREIGQKWPDNVDIVVLEQTSAKIYLVLPPEGVREESVSGDLSDATELEPRENFINLLSLTHRKCT